MMISERLVLRPLAIPDAGDMVSVLADPELYRFTGGRPPTLEELENRYFAQLAGDPLRVEDWRNWIVRRRIDDVAVGFTQATIIDGVAELAWVIGAAFQGAGFATEAALATRRLLETEGVARFRATIHPEHEVSGRVASAIGLIATGEIDDGEIVWRSLDGNASPA